LPKRLNVAVIRKNDKTVYGFGFFDQEDTGFANPKLKFEKSKYSIVLKLSGDNIEDTEYEFVLENKEGSLSMKIAAE